VTFLLGKIISSRLAYWAWLSAGDVIKEFNSYFFRIIFFASFGVKERGEEEEGIRLIFGLQ
jgi:hypothetical protein